MAETLDTIAVEPWAIESGLKNLKANNRSSVTASERTIKAAVANLIVLGELGKAEEVSAILSRVTKTFPTKIFHLSSSEDDNALLTEVGIPINRISGDEVIQSEMIRLRVGKGRVKGIPSLLFGNLQSDVPIIALMLGDFCDDSLGVSGEIFSAMGEYIDRVVFDSTTIQCLGEAVASLKSLVGSGETFSVYDLSWYKMERFRNIVVEVFDSERVSDPLTAISELKLSYSSKDGMLSAEAALAVKWIMFCLDWKTTDRAAPGRVTCVRSDGSPSILRISKQELDDRLDQDFSIAFVSEDGERTVKALKMKSHWEFQVNGVSSGSFRATIKEEKLREEMVLETLFSAKPDTGPREVLNGLEVFLKDLSRAGLSD